MAAYYNEIDPKAAAWLRELITAGLIAPGDVDERSIWDVEPLDLIGYDQCHFFAGVGGWSLALRLAGVPDNFHIWTGSCPCHPFSAAGRRLGVADERHLWPAFEWLIGQCKPASVVGEQVAAGPAKVWIDLVSHDLESMGYAFGAVAFPACSVGAPHIRQRTYWVARARGERLDGVDALLQRGRPQPHRAEASWGGEAGGLADNNSNAIGQGSAFAGRRYQRGDAQARARFGGRERVSNLEHPDDDEGPQGRRVGRYSADQLPAGAASVAGFWRDADWIYCRDGKYRPVEPGTFPLAHGVSARVVKLRGYGNAIVPQQAATFLRAAL